MPGSRDISAISADHMRAAVQTAVFTELAFTIGTTRMSSLPGDITIGGDIWYGVGDLLTVEYAEENTSLVASAATIALDGLKTSLIANSLSTAVYQDRAARIFLAVTQPGAAPDRLLRLFEGTMESVRILVDGATATIEISCETPLRRLNQAFPSRYNASYQRGRYAGDTFCDWLTGNLQENWKGLRWGARG